MSDSSSSEDETEKHIKSRKVGIGKDAAVVEADGQVDDDDANEEKTFEELVSFSPVIPSICVLFEEILLRFDEIVSTKFTKSMMSSRGT